MSPSQDNDPVAADELPEEVAWFCLRTHPKHEHLAASHLRRYEGLEVLNPRVKYPRSTRNGKVIVTEALFPNYLFARFNWKTSLNRVHYAPGIGGIVHFGNRWPTIPPSVIEGLRNLVGTDEIHEIPDEVKPGDIVDISGGAFHGLQAVVMRIMPGRDRVTVLLDFLGRQTAVEVHHSSIVHSGIRR